MKFTKTGYYGVAISIFLAMNLVRVALLSGTGEATYFQADYALPPIFLWAALRLRAPRWFAAIGTFLLSLLAVCCDAVLVIGRRFRWGPDALPQYLQGYQDLPWSVIVPTAALLLAGAALVSLPLGLKRRRPFALWPLPTLLVVLLAIDTQIGTSRFRDGTAGINLITTAIPSIAPIYLNGAVQGGSLQTFHRKTMYSDVDRHNPPPQILSISLESFGLAREPNRRAALIEPLIRELGGLYQVEQGAHDYFGATLQGEVRELCGERLFGNAAQDGVLRQLSRCLPSQLRRRGYDTVALHGNGGRFYSRWAVYPAMGFRQSFFYDDLAAADPAVTACPETAFNAACDERVYSRAIGLFDGQKRFVHVMTLDSHLPVLDAEPGSCSSVFAENRSLCGYAKLLQRSLAQLGRALHNAKVQPDVVFIYGDHAPPFASEPARKVFSAEAVPYLILRKRGPQQDRQPSAANDAAARVVR